MRMSTLSCFGDVSGAVLVGNSNSLNGFDAFIVQVPRCRNFVELFLLRFVNAGGFECGQPIFAISTDNQNVCA